MMADGRSDDDLVAATLAGDREVFGVLVERYILYVRAIARRSGLADPGVDDDDVAQEVFLRVYTRLAAYLPSGHFRPWLGRIAANCCVDHQRRRSFVVTNLVPQQADRAPGPEEVAIERNRSDIVTDALLTLSPAHQSVLWLYYWDGLGYADIAKMLAIPVTTVRTRIFRGRGYMRAALAGMREMA